MWNMLPLVIVAERDLTGDRPRKTIVAFLRFARTLTKCVIFTVIFVGLTEFNAFDSHTKRMQRAGVAWGIVQSQIGHLIYLQALEAGVLSAENLRRLEFGPAATLSMTCVVHTHVLAFCDRFGTNSPFFFMLALMFEAEIHLVRSSERSALILACGLVAAEG